MIEQITFQYLSYLSSAKFLKKFFIIVYNYFSVNNLLSSQFGLRSGASTQHAILKFSDDIQKLFDQKKVPIATFMDLSKAFDVWIIIFYYLNSNDMASMKLHCNESIVTYQVNIMSLGTILTHLH